MEFFSKIKTKFFCPRTVPARLWRSTEPVDRTGPVDRRAQNVHAGLPLGPVDRAVDRLQAPHSRVGAVDRTVDREAWQVDRAVNRPESICSLDWDGRALASNGQKFDRWRSTGPVNRQPPDLIFSSNDQFLWRALNTPFVLGFWTKISRVKYTEFLQCFKLVFKSVLVPKRIHLICFLGFGKIKENLDLGYLLSSSFL